MPRLGRGVLAVDGAQIDEQGRLDLARVARVSGRTLAPRIPGGVVQHALAAVLALFRTQLLLAPVAVDGQRFRTLATRSARPLVHSAHADHAIPVAHARLTVAAHVSGCALARPVGRVQHAVVLADVPQRFVRYHHRGRFRLSRGDVLQNTTTNGRQRSCVTVAFPLGPNNNFSNFGSLELHT